MREFCTSGSVGGEGGNILTYPADTQLGAGFCWDLQQAFCTDVGHHAASGDPPTPWDAQHCTVPYGIARRVVVPFAAAHMSRPGTDRRRKSRFSISLEFQ